MASAKQSPDYMKKWRKKNRKHIRKYEKKYYAKLSPERKAVIAARRREHHLKSSYGISQQEWEILFKRQNGVCALCQIPNRTGKHGILAVDHCHETGRVRGLLCSPCNISLGILGDTPMKIQQVLEYVCNLEGTIAP